MLGRVLRAGFLGLALTVFGTVMGLAVVEAGFYAYNWLYPPTAKGFFWEPHDGYGWGLKANREAPYYDDKGEFRSRPRVNSQGLRDVEHDYEKPDGVYRILILGDSYMEGFQVELDQLFARLLDRDLNAGAARKIEVINSGVSSYGTDNELLFYRLEGHKYDPDLVLLMFTTGNDIRESYEPFNEEAMGANLTKPNFSLDDRGALQVHPGEPPPPPMPWWRRWFYVGDYLYFRLGGTLNMGTPNPHALLPPADTSIPYVAPDIFVYAPDYRPEVAEGWRVTRALLLELRREVAARGSKLAVVVHSPPWAHDDGRWNFMTMRHPVAQKTWDRKKPNRLVDAFLTDQHIPFLDLYDTFDARKNAEQLFYKFDPHWTPAGHRLAADAVAAFLRRDDLVPTAAGATPR